MKKARLWIILLIVIAVLVLLKIFVFKKETPALPPGGRPGGGSPTALVTGYVVHPQTLTNAAKAIGTLTANEMVELRAEASGMITGIYFREGQHVQSGTLLIKINDADLQAQKKRLEAQLSLAEQKASRIIELRKIEGVSQEELDIANAEIAIIHADLSHINAQIAKTELRAPFAGKLGLKQVSLGSYLSPSITVVSLQQLNPIKIDFTLPQKYAGSIREGQKITFELEGKPGQLQGTVVALNPNIDLNTRTIMVRALGSNPQGRLLPGAFVRVDVGLGTQDNAMMVPTEAIVPILKGKKIFVSRNGISAEIEVETGLRSESMIEIISDELQSGDTVVITGLMGLRAGAQLNFKEVKHADQ
jgi:membrane fusion protein, multidrug efflux system